MKEINIVDKNNVILFLEKYVKLINNEDYINFFQTGYKWDLKKDRIRNKSRKEFFKELNKIPLRKTVLKTFSHDEIEDLIIEDLIKEINIDGTIYLRPTLLSLYYAKEKEFMKYLKFNERIYHDIIIKTFQKKGYLNSLQLAIVFLFILNGNVNKENALNIDLKNNIEDEFLRPWLLNFADKIDSLLENDKHKRIKRTVKEIFRTDISIINNKLGYPIKKIESAFHYYFDKDLSDFTINRIKRNIDQYKKTKLQNLCKEYFQKLINMKGKFQLYRIKSNYQPIIVNSIFSKFDLTL
ncbi:MAG: hypothetical protein GF364_13420 [Candidatus Lokiarchaeota archaeon]|nr:hypothetical protein [Candidatus Lokiarchaeota archaeon]